MKKSLLIIAISIFLFSLLLVATIYCYKNLRIDNNIILEPGIKQVDQMVAKEIKDVFIQHQQVGGVFEISRFENGINKIDLLNDGTKNDLVISARRNNGTSPHSYTTYNFFTASNNQYLSLVQIQDKDVKENLKDALATFEGAGCSLRDMVFIKQSSITPILVMAYRDFGDSFMDNQKVRFDFYELRHNEQGEYMPDHWFQYVDSSMTAAEYCDVNEAIDKELKMIY